MSFRLAYEKAPRCHAGEFGSCRAVDFALVLRVYTKTKHIEPLWFSSTNLSNVALQENCIRAFAVFPTEMRR